MAQLGHRTPLPLEVGTRVEVSMPSERGATLFVGDVVRAETVWDRLGDAGFDPS